MIEGGSTDKPAAHSLDYSGAKINAMAHDCPGERPKRHKAFPLMELAPQSHLVT